MQIQHSLCSQRSKNRILELILLINLLIMIELHVGDVAILFSRQVCHWLSFDRLVDTVIF